MGFQEPLPANARTSRRVLFRMHKHPRTAFGTVRLMIRAIVLLQPAAQVARLSDIQAPIFLGSENVNHKRHNWALLDLNQ